MLGQEIGHLMSWSVRLQDESGRPVSSEDADIEFQTIPAEGMFKLLHYIDPYGDTYFNTIQMNDFLADWNCLVPEAGQKEKWEVVLNMALRCRNEPHLYLRFIGD